METSEDRDFLDFIKKKWDLWEEDELQGNVDTLIRACTKKYNNIAKSTSKKKKSKAQQEDQDTKFVALLTQMLPLLTNAYATNGNGSDNGNGRKRGNNSDLEVNPFSMVEPYHTEFVGDSIIKYG